jgi:hypothetical protein
MPIQDNDNPGDDNDDVVDPALEDDDEADDDNDLDVDFDESDEDESEGDEEDDGTGPRKAAGRKNSGGTGRDEEKSPEQLKKELDATRAKLAKSRREQTRWKNRAQAKDTKATDGREPTAGDKRAVKAVVAKGGTDAEAREKGAERGLTREDVAEMIAEARETEARKAAEKYKPVAIRSEAKDLLTDAGYKFGSAEDRDRRLDRALKLIDMDQVEVDDDGTVLGLEDEIDKLRDDWPELFADETEEEPEPVKPAARRRVAPRINGRAGRAARASTRELSASEGQLAYLRGHGQR